MNRYIYNVLILFCLIINGSNNMLSAQVQEKVISATIVDEKRNPLEGVQVLVQGGQSTVTDSAGNFEIRIEDNPMLIIEKNGYDAIHLNISEIPDQIILKKAGSFAHQKETIELGFRSKTLREIAGSVSSITPKYHLTFDNTQNVNDYIEGLLPGVRGSANIRGMAGQALFVIDGVIGRSPDLLTMEEVDQITVLKDANAVAMYGSQARNGIIVITTKRGEANKKATNVNVRNGIKDPISLPRYLSSGEYMRLFNEARINDGQELQYDPLLIEKFESNTNPYRYPNIDFYSDDYLRAAVGFTDINAEFSGGDRNTQFYVNMGWSQTQPLAKTNPQANTGSNNFNVRGNIDFRINHFIRSSVGAVAILGSNKTSLGNLLSRGTNFKPNAYAPLLPVSMIDTTGNPALAEQLNAANIYDGMLLGGTQQFPDDTPVAAEIAGGYQNSIFRSTQFHNTIDFDLSMLADGLSAKSLLSFDFHDSYRLSINNRYRVYEPTWEGDKIIRLTPYGDVDQRDLTENVSTNDFTTRVGFYGLLNYEKELGERHAIYSTLLGFYNTRQGNNRMQPQRNPHIGLQVSYSFDNKLFADVSSAYVYSNKLPEGNRGGFAPTAGLGYILSEESFMSNLHFINYLKLKATAGVLKSDLGISNYYMYDETYSAGELYRWNDGGNLNHVQNISQGANYLLGYEERVDMNLGFETYLMNAIWLDFNYFKMDIDKQLVTLDYMYPTFYDVFKPYDNYNKDTYTGFELGMNYSKRFNDITFRMGGNLMYAQSERTKRNEIYQYDYQYHEGTAVGSILGLTDLGFYSQEDFVTDSQGNLRLKDHLPVPAFGAVQPGDIKYIDVNSDGIIDDNDRTFIGQDTNPWSYGVNLRLKYKGFSVFVLGVGQVGGNAITSDNYYWVDGNDKYSEIVLNRWTPETAGTATFPRLSATENNNNFRTSTFWMYNNSFFTIQRTQITYEFSERFCQMLKLNSLSVNIAGSNLLEISQNSSVRQLEIGGDPQFRFFSVGLRTSF